MGALRLAGVQTNDRVALLCGNVPAMIEAHFAVPAIGAILVPVNIRLSADEVAYILDHSGARLLIAGSEFAPLATDAYRRLAQPLPTVWVTHGDGSPAAPSDLNGISYEAFLATGSPQPLRASLDPTEGEDATISINYTSGTTGRPKGVMVHHRGAYQNALGEIISAGLTTDSIYLWTLPMFHCNGWCFPWAVVAIGGTQVCLPTF